MVCRGTLLKCSGLTPGFGSIPNCSAMLNIGETSYSEVARKLNVSDVSVKKRITKHSGRGRDGNI